MVSGGPGWPTALWKQWPSDSQKIHQQACSSPAASRSHPHRLDSMLSVKTSHPSKLAPLHAPTTPRDSLLQDEVPGLFQIPSIITYIPVPGGEITGKICR